ncbi:MAG: heavy-metal-associated domain-containing protein [Acidimicrobiales bacterium]|jgi:copper chaperone CopZ
MTSPSPWTSPQEPADPGTSATTTTELAVVGMHCGSCVALVEEALIERSGVISASVDLDAARAVIGYDPSLVGIDELRSTIEEAGYSATPVD